MKSIDVGIRVLQFLVIVLAGVVVLDYLTLFGVIHR